MKKDIELERLLAIDKLATLNAQMSFLKAEEERLTEVLNRNVQLYEHASNKDAKKTLEEKLKNVYVKILKLNLAIKKQEKVLEKYSRG